MNCHIKYSKCLSLADTHAVACGGLSQHCKWLWAVKQTKLTEVHFTALHVMRTRYSDENSVRPSVCLSVRLTHAWIVTKRKQDLSRFLYHN